MFENLEISKNQHIFDELRGQGGWFCNKYFEIEI